MWLAHPSQNQIAIHHPFPSDASMCLLVGDRLVSLLTTVLVVFVHNIGVTDMLTKDRRRNLGSICRILVGK